MRFLSGSAKMASIMLVPDCSALLPWVMQEALARYTPTDLQVAVEDEWEGQKYTYTRGWVIWHVIEHDLHHGGEIGYSLGMHGLQALDI